MYVPPLYRQGKVATPEEYTARARAKIEQTLYANINLKYGSSPLKESLNASNLDVLSNHNTSSESLNLLGSSSGSCSSSINVAENKKHKSFFTFKSKKPEKEHNAQNSYPPAKGESEESHYSLKNLSSRSILHPTKSYSSSRYSGNSSIFRTNTNRTTADSIFSSNTRYSASTELTNYTLFHNDNNSISGSVPPIHMQENHPPIIPLSDFLPRSYDDMYSPELLQDRSKLTKFGRPSFTQRKLINWTLNDIRSLMIVDELRPEWCGQLPLVVVDEFSYELLFNDIYTETSTNVKLGTILKTQYLPLCSPDDVIVHTLIESDIYAENGFDLAFRGQTAAYTIKAARLRHRQSASNAFVLSKPEWRNIIENFLLNLAVEAQCRADFKRNCAILKRNKKINEVGSGGGYVIPHTPSSGSSSNGRQNQLLKKAIMNGVNTNIVKNGKLTKEEKSKIWIDTQMEVYKRVGLDWVPDNL